MQYILAFIYQTPNQSNGGVNSIHQILMGLSGFTPIIVTNTESKKTAAWRAQGWDVQLLEPPKRQMLWLWLWQKNAQRRRLLALANQYSIRLVHFNDIHYFRWFGEFMASEDFKVVFNCRDLKAPGDAYGGHWKGLASAHSIIALSADMQASLEARLPLRTYPKASSFIYSIVDRASFFPDANLREKMFGRDGFHHLLYVAAFMDKKNQLGLLRALDRAWLETHRIKLHFIGDFEPNTNAYAASCAKLRVEKGLEGCVLFEGYRPDIADWYKAADLTLVCSRREGLARCMIESIACGTPVVSFDVCSAREVLEGGGCGRVVSQGNYEALFNEALSLLKDNGRRQQMGHSGVLFAEKHFSNHLVIASYERIYNAILQ